MIYLLAILLASLLGVSYFLVKKEIVAPAFVFTLSFCFCSAWAVLYSVAWKLNDMYINTFFVIIIGVVEFIVVTLLLQNFYEKRGIDDYQNAKSEIGVIKVHPIIKILCVCFVILIFVINMKFIIDRTNGSLYNIKQAIYEYDRLIKFSDSVVKPAKIVGISLIIINALAYWFEYVVVNNFIAEKKLDLLSLIIVFLCIVVSLLNGGRNGTVNLIIAGFAFSYILLKKKYSYKEKIKISNTIKVVLIAVPLLFLVSFPYVARLLGRNITGNMMDYLAIYCGAEIKNLDIYLKERDFSGTNIEKDDNCQSFNCIINWLGPKFGLLDEEYKLDLPFRRVNGYGLGNVYTTFYPYIYDFGYKGLVVLVGIMALILQFVYEKTRRTSIKNIPNIWILIYGYMFSSILLSFFSNKFYEQNFNRSLVYGVVLWIVFGYVLCDDRREKIVKKIKSFGEKSNN